MKSVSMGPQAAPNPGLLRRPRAIAVVAALAALGCDRDPTHGKLAASNAALATIPLAEARGGALSPPSPRVRIVVSSEAIHVDNAARFASLPRPARERMLRALPAPEAEELPFFHRDLVRLDHGKLAPPDDLAPTELLIPSLGKVLEYAMGIEKVYAVEAPEDRDEGAIPDREANIYLDRETPYELVVRVFFTASTSDMRPVPVARGPGGEVALALGDPSSEEVGCTVPELTLSPSGVTVVRGSAWPMIVVADSPERAPAREEHCRSVPPKDGDVDQERLRALLMETAKEARGCGIARVAAEKEIPWREVVAAMGAAAEAGYPEAQLTMLRKNRAACR